MKIIHFFLFVIIMIVATSCRTTSFVESTEDSYDTESSYFRTFNPLNYEMYYNTVYGYHYYDHFRTRFCFDDFMYFFYPELGVYRYGRYHWDLFGYRDNHCFNRIDHHRNLVQRHEEPSYYMKKGSNGTYEREARRIQNGNNLRNNTQGSATTRQKTGINNSSNVQSRSRQIQNAQTQRKVKTQSGTRQRTETNSPSRNANSGSRAVQGKPQSNSSTRVANQGSSVQNSTRQGVPVNSPSGNVYRNSGTQQQGTQRNSSPSTYQRSPNSSQQMSQPNSQRSGSYGRQH